MWAQCKHRGPHTEGRRVRIRLEGARILALKMEMGHKLRNQCRQPVEGGKARKQILSQSLERKRSPAGTFILGLLTSNKTIINVCL